MSIKHIKVCDFISKTNLFINFCIDAEYRALLNVFQTAITSDVTLMHGDFCFLLIHINYYFCFTPSDNIVNLETNNGFL